MRDLEDTLKFHVDEADGSPAAKALRKAWRHETQALRQETVWEWAEQKKAAIDAYVACFRAVVEAQKCKCLGVCPGGAACVDIPETGPCPCCQGPASECKPRHARGASCA